MLIAIEGIDGSGKSSLAQSLTESLNRLDTNTKCIPAFDLTEWGDYARRYLLNSTDDDSYDKDLVIGLLAVINFHVGLSNVPFSPILTRDHPEQHLILDRYYFSTLAYYKSNINHDLVCYQALQLLVEYLPSPDIVFHIEVNPATAINRLKSTRSNLECYENLDRLEKVHNSYEEIYSSYPYHVTLYVLDGNKSTQELTDYCLKVISNYVTVKGLSGQFYQLMEDQYGQAV